MYICSVQRILDHYTVQLDKTLFVKDPSTSEVGKEIVRQSVKLLAQEGIESFNFKKLSNAIASTETTVYRYFSNKHQLVMYLSSWYWVRLESRILFATANIRDPKEQLQKAVKELSTRIPKGHESPQMEEDLLQELVFNDSWKAFDTNLPNSCNPKSYYLAYEDLCDRLAKIIHSCDKAYKTPKALSSALIDTAHRQMFFQKHLSHISDIGKTNKSIENLLLSMVEHFIK